jgi:lambda family phage portal protein
MASSRKLGRLLGTARAEKPRAGRAVRGRYDSAATNSENSRHWANADGLSAAAANDAGVRQTLRNRSRYEAANNGYAAGIARTRADDLVGTGPTLQVPVDDEQLAQAVEQSWAAWAKEVRLAEKLHTMDLARMVDGEAFALLVEDPSVRHAVRINLTPVEADHVCDPAGYYPRVNPDADGWLDGVRYDRFQNPVEYAVLRHHPGDDPRGFTREYDRYRAEYVCHWFRRDRPGQLRGVPELTPSLPLFAIQRRFTLATLLAAETAANFALMLETDAPAYTDGDDPPPTPFEALEIERNMMTTLPAGTKAKQLAAEHPQTTYPEFKWEILAECARPVRMPVNVAAGDTSKANFSSAKIDHLGYRHGLRVDRAACEAAVIDRVYALWLDLAVLAGAVPPDAAGLPHKWYWPGWVSWDKSEALQDAQMLASGTTTRAELLAEWGLDWRDVLRQLGKEKQLMDELGLSPEPEQPEPPAGDPVGARMRLNGHLNGHGGKN